MFKAVISTSTIVNADTNIPFSVVKNTNDDVSYNASTNTVTFNNPGIYDVSMQTSITNAVVGEVTLTEYQNGTSVPYATSGVTINAVTDNATLYIPDVLTIKPSVNSDKASLSFQLNVKATLSSAIFTIERRR